MVLQSSLSDSKSPRVSRTLLSILANLNNALVWMVTTCPHISKSFSLFTKSLVDVSSALITTGITVTFLYHCSYSRLARSWYLSRFSLSFNFTLWSAWTATSTIWQVLFFFFFSFFFFFFFSWQSLGLIVWQRWSDIPLLLLLLLLSSFLWRLLKVLGVYELNSGRKGQREREKGMQ